MQPSASTSKNAAISRKKLALLVVGLLFLYLLLPQLGSFRSSLEIIKHANLAWLAVGLCATVATSGVAAAIYTLLAKRPIRYPRTLLIQLASLFANRVLPSGIGTIGLNYDFLRRQKHTQSEASAVVATNTILGFTGHVLLFIIVVSGLGGSVRGVSWPQFSSKLVWLAGSLMLVVLLVVLAKLRRRLQSVFIRTVAGIGQYKTRPFRLTAVLVCSMLLTSFYALSLYACTRAVGMHDSFATIFIVLTIGVAGATAVPAPGGLGAAETALVGGLVFYGASGADGLAAVLLYRLFTYWLALPAGAVALVLANRRGYV